MNKPLLILSAIIVAAALIWAWTTKTDLTTPETVTIRGTVIEPLDPTDNLTSAKIQNYDDLTEWTINISSDADNANELRRGMTISAEGRLNGTRLLDASIITQTTIPGIEITKPIENELAGFPIVIEGKGRAFENTIGLIIKDDAGNTLAQLSTMVDAPDVGLFGRFHVETTYKTPKSTTGTVEVYEASAKDGEHINTVVVPIKFPNVEISEVKVFFSSRTEDPEAINCEKVYPVTRQIIKTEAVAQASINELLKGVTENESWAGAFTNIPEGAKLNSIKIENGTATVDFNENLDRGVGGSCRVSAIGAQIRQTLLQFPTVKKVVISRNGNIDEVLQP